MLKYTTACAYAMALAHAMAKAITHAYAQEKRMLSGG